MIAMIQRHWNARVQRRAAAVVAHEDALRHAQHATLYTQLMNKGLREAETFDHGDPRRDRLREHATMAGEMALYHHHMAGGDVATAAEHRAAAMQISAMLARVPVREMA